MLDDPNAPDPSAATAGSRSAEALASALALMAETTRAFAESRNIEATLARALEMIVDQLEAEVGSLWLLDADGEVMECRASSGPNPITGLRLPSGKGIVGRCVTENACKSVLDVRADPHFTGAVDAESGFVTHSLICAPMSISEQRLGAIELVNKKGPEHHFSEGDIDALRVLAASAALAVSNARMARSLVESERVQRELELAAEIQRNLLPRRQSGLPVGAANLPARTVSGDFYDYLMLSDGRLHFCLGDVSGKGMNAALLMAKTASLYRCLAKSIDRPGELLEKLNDELAETATRGMFVTMVAGILEVETGRVVLGNAGHEPPLCHTPGTPFRAFPAAAPPLGILHGGSFPESELALDGGSLYVFSDGLTEAATQSGRQLGAEGVEKVIERHAIVPIDARVDAILAEVAALELRDDATLLALCDAGRKR